MIRSSIKAHIHPNYFWVILALGFCLSLLQGSALNSVLSVFIKPMTEEFGWSRSTISGVATLGAFSSGLLGLLVGPVMDRRGVRLLAVLGIVVLGGSLAGLGLVGEVWSFYAVNVVARITSLGVISVALTVVMSNWFVKLRGRAMGITYMGGRLGGALLPLLALFLVANQGWRLAWLTLGIMVLALAVPVMVFLRHRPEDVGLLPDGVGPAAAGILSSRRPSRPDAALPWTRKSAARTPSLWLLAIVAAQAYLGMGGLNLHLVPFLTDVGIPTDQAVGTLTVMALTSAGGGLLCGALAERIHVRYVLAASCAVAAAGTVFLPSVHSLATAYTYAVVGGIGLGGTVSLSGMVWAEYFGRKSVGAIQGLVMPITMSGNAIGPLLTGWAYDVSGSYAPAFAILGAGYVVAAVCALLARPADRGGSLPKGQHGNPHHPKPLLPEREKRGARQLGETPKTPQEGASPFLTTLLGKEFIADPE
ncbi:MAG: MFS transporter [Dehalococcoidia bacterium]|nr:MFS transporter [Dehalococcoidia bacterium]